MFLTTIFLLPTDSTKNTNLFLRISAYSAVSFIVNELHEPHELFVSFVSFDDFLC